jgi:diguanylate cyclase (GGDEF)-like protein
MAASTSSTRPAAACAAGRWTAAPACPAAGSTRCCAAGHGRLYAGTPAGLFRLDPGAQRFVAVPIVAGDAPELSSLAEDSQGRLWIGTLRNGAFVIAADGEAAQPVLDALPAALGEALDQQAVIGIAEVQAGEVWLATAAQGIVAVDVASRQTRRIRNVPTLPVTLSDNAVRGLHRDRSGLVWVVTNRGVSRHDPRQSALLTMHGAPQPASSSVTDGGPPRAEVSWILPITPRRIWLGTHKGGVHIIDPTGARVAQLRPDPTRPDSALPADNVLALERAGDGSVFIGTKRGLYRAREDGSGVVRVRLGQRDPSASTWALLADGRTLWIGGQADGLWRLDLITGQAAPLPPALARQLSDQRVIVLARAAGGGLWVGTRYGLNHVDPAYGTVRRILPEPTRPGGLAAGFITTLYTDREQRLWVGTYGGGIGILAPGAAATPRLQPLSIEQGLPDNTVNALIDDAAGAVWASTDSGLARIDPKTLAVRALRRAEGLVFNTYWTGSAARTAEGELLFGGGGLSIVRPDRLQSWGYRPPLVVTDLRIGGQPVPAGRYVSAGAPARPITVPADGNSLAVEFAALDYSSPERNRYAYRLQGFDADWVPTDAGRRVAAYTNLPPGDYQLMLRGSNRDGTWSEKELRLPVKVLPAWHQTLWFRAVLLLALALLLMLVVRWRTQRLRQREAELESKVLERTAELEAMSRALTEKSRVLEQSSLSDPLTGLRNRRLLTEQIDALVAAAMPDDTCHLFLLVDVDHFKRVNDQLGHAAGDAVLVQFAQRLQALLRGPDLLVRWGGEEFLIVAQHLRRAEAAELADRYRAAVEATPFIVDNGQHLTLRCSIGWACMPFLPAQPGATAWPEVVKLADLALLAAKRIGRNTCIGLLAGERAQPDGLSDRIQADPQGAVARGDVRLVSTGDPTALMAALARRGESEDDD